MDSYGTLRDRIAVAAYSPLKVLRTAFGGGQTGKHDGANSADKEIWALRNVSLEISRGEIVGVIGVNGAGKSTLLKIISRITGPTEGQVEILGRVGSLLEVGTGFHPELTGRENIYLNGAILGMKKSEISRQFDAIVDFAETERFLDTPIKRYSSGMYVRLAFAVAAHLEPEILAVDEVLAVGDVAFQRKSLDKMNNVAGSGRTVLFVSHNTGAIANLCTRVILFSGGTIIADGPTDEVLAKYLSMVSETSESTFSRVETSGGRASIDSVVLKTPDGQQNSSFLMTDPIHLECGISIKERASLTLSAQIKETNGSPIFHFPNGDAEFDMPSSPGLHKIVIRIPPLNLYPGEYRLRLALTDVAYSEQAEAVGINLEILQDYPLSGRPLVRQAGLVFDVPEWSSSPQVPKPVSDFGE